MARINHSLKSRKVPSWDNIDGLSGCTALEDGQGALPCASHQNEGRAGAVSPPFADRPPSLDHTPEDPGISSKRGTQSPHTACAGLFPEPLIDCTVGVSTRGQGSSVARLQGC